MSNTDRKCELWCAKILTADTVKAAINKGLDTSRTIANEYGVTACTAAQDLKTLYDSGVLLRERCGTAYVYTINED